MNASSFGWAAVLAGLLVGGLAHAQSATPGYLERVVQWTVQPGERCVDVARGLYGDAQRIDLVTRYNALDCALPLAPGVTLTLPEAPTELPVAALRSMTPDVRARAPGGEWASASNGMAFYKNHQLSTQAKANADVLFRDRSRLFVAEHTLVVIYGSAGGSSQRQVPPAVQLDEGEVQVALAALGGRPVAVASSGGELRAQSKDAVVRRKRSRSTVSVFQGSVEVVAAGQTVNVPERFGTALTQGSAPEAPRPLPPAPEWTQGASDGVVIGAAGVATIVASWAAVANAVGYRIELSQDADFVRPVVREEVSADVRAFRAERMPVGSYHLRVRAMDSQDFLGIAALRELRVIEAKFSGAPGVIGDRTLRTNRYATLRLDSPELELSAGAGFVACPCSVALSAGLPPRIWVRAKGQQPPSELAIEYQPVEASVASSWSHWDGPVRVAVALQGLEAVALEERVRPRLRIRRGKSERFYPLGFASGRAHALLDGRELPARSEVEVVDVDGYVLGRSALVAPARPAALPRLRTRPTLPFEAVSAEVSAAHAQLRPERAVAIDIAASSQESRAGAVARLRARQPFGAWGFEAGLNSPALANAAAVDSSSFIGLSHRLGLSPRFGIGPAFRLALPLAERAGSARLESALALSHDAERSSYALTFGLRSAPWLVPARERFPRESLFLLGLFSRALSERALLYAALDAHLLSAQQPALFRAGATFGAEIGSAWFGSAALRISPWDEGGRVSGQLGLGLRVE